jgi:hypothetical protein
MKLNQKMINFYHKMFLINHHSLQLIVVLYVVEYLMYFDLLVLLIEIEIEIEIEIVVVVVIYHLMLNHHLYLNLMLV